MLYYTELTLKIGCFIQYQSIILLILELHLKHWDWEKVFKSATYYRLVNNSDAR